MKPLLLQFRQTRWEPHQMCHIGSCFATNWMINRAVQPAVRHLAVVRSSVESDWLWEPREQMGRGHRAGPNNRGCLHGSASKNHFYPRLYLRVIQHTHTHVLQAACSSWQVISAFSAAPLTLIMQLNAALWIPTAAHPHYNTLPRSPTLSVSVTHTHHSVSLFFPPWLHSQLSVVKDSIFLHALTCE